ncbi:MAG TPA: SPFH domain-containing protein [Candidatus Saccharimonadales bacterium]|nr:SPFH domain-containing protein [Candidatus Saccharimonadales bacterium]
MGDFLEVVLWLLGIAAALVALYLVVKNSIFIVQQDSVIVVKRWGKHNRVLGPGLHGRIPFADTKHRTFSRQRSSLSLDLRGDSGGTLPVELSVELELRGVTDEAAVMRVAYEIERPQQHLSTVATATIRQFLLPLTYEQILADGELGTKLATELESVADECGYTIVGVRITSIRPDRSVQEAIVAGERNKHVRADEAAQTEHAATMRIKGAESTAAASAIEAKAERDKLDGQTTQVAELLERLVASGASKDNAAGILTALLYQQTVTTVGSNAKAQIILTPAGVAIPDDISGLVSGKLVDAPTASTE